MSGSAAEQTAEDLARIGEALCGVFPALVRVAPLRVLGAGFGSVAVETAGGQVFRIAKSPAAAARHANEVRLLPALRTRVPVAVPDPRWHAGSSASLPFGVMEYPKLPGAPLRPEWLARTDSAPIAFDIAAFLLALHRFPIAEAEALGLPGPESSRAVLEALRADVLPPLRDALAAIEYRRITTWWDAFLADERMRRYRPALRHGDLWYENILVDEARERVVGVVDFECAAVGDPAQDFATQLHLGRRFAAQVIDAYRTLGGELDEDFSHRLWRFWELREFDGVQLAVQSGDSAEFEDAVRKLRRGPVLSPLT
ncbi:MAG: phosphotransferase family protein [Thermomicrobiales bacterium]